MDFDLIWSKYQIYLYNFIKGNSKSKTDAEDILQEVAIKFQQAMEKQHIENHKSWLFQVARNTVADFYRKESKNFAIQNTELNDILDNKVSSTCFCDLTAFVIKNYLPEAYGSPLFMSDIEMLPQKEIALKLNLSLTATKSRIQRARKLLKKKVEHCIEITYRPDGSVSDFYLKPGCKLPDNILTEIEKLKIDF